jgi:hypothetical protein
MQNLRILACVVAALGSLVAAGCGGGDDDCDNDNHNNGSNCVCDSNNNCLPPEGGVLRVENQSGFAITEIHVAPVGSTTWGPNLISGTTLAPGNSLTVSVACDQYDALLIDEAGDQCTVHNVDLCFSNADWIIRNDTCSAFTNKDPKAAGAAPASGAAH